MAATWDFELMLRSRGARGGGNAQRRRAVEFLAGARRRPPAAVAAAVRDVRRGSVPRHRHGGRRSPRLSGGRSRVADACGATLKHYIGYSVPTSGHDRTPALIPDITLRDTLLPPFAAAVKAGALAVMVNSGEVNGIPGHVNSGLLNDVLRGELGFDGVIVSDWEDIKKLVNMHHTAANEKDATRAAVLAGIDMSMVPSDYSFSDLLVQLVNEGRGADVARIDDAVTRILTLKARVGLLDSSDGAPATAITVGSAASRQVALRRGARVDCAREERSGSVAARPVCASPADRSDGRLAGLAEQRLDDHLAWRPRLSLSGRSPDGPTRPRGSPRRPTDLCAWRVVRQGHRRSGGRHRGLVRRPRHPLCLGEMSYAETPGNIDDLQLPDAQLRLAEAVLAAGKPVILLMIEGRPRIIRTIADRAAGIVIALNPGMEGGTAIADILSGEINPSGRLPITYPRFPNALFTYDYKAYDDRDLTAASTTFKPQFAFGSGSELYDLRIRRPQHGQQGHDVRPGHRHVGHGPQHGETRRALKSFSCSSPIASRASRRRSSGSSDSCGSTWLRAARKIFDSISPATTCRSSTPAGVQSPSRACSPSRWVA